MRLSLKYLKRLAKNIANTFLKLQNNLEPKTKTMSRKIEVNVETIDNGLYVSESVRTPGYTHKSYYPVEH